MSLDDGLTMQIHPGSFRDHNPTVFKTFGKDKGCDIPTRTDYVRALKPLLDRYGNARNLTIILFTLDETSYARELAPLAGHYPALRLGRPGGFTIVRKACGVFASRRRRRRASTTPSDSTYDTRAFLSIPARHDVARRVDSGFLGRLVAEHRIDLDEALDIAQDLAYRLVKTAYKL